MRFINFLSVILGQKSVDLIKIIDLQSQEIAVLKAMVKTGRKFPNLHLHEKRILATLAYEIIDVLRLGKMETIIKPESLS